MPNRQFEQSVRVPIDLNGKKIVLFFWCYLFRRLKRDVCQNFKILLIFNLALVIKKWPH